MCIVLLLNELNFMFILSCKLLNYIIFEAIKHKQYLRFYLLWEVEVVIIAMSQMKNSIRDARTPQPGEIFFNTMRYRSSATVQSSRYFQSSVSYIKVQIMLKLRK